MPNNKNELKDELLSKVSGGAYFDIKLSDDVQGWYDTYIDIIIERWNKDGKEWDPATIKTKKENIKYTIKNCKTIKEAQDTLLSYYGIDVSNLV